MRNVVTRLVSLLEGLTLYIVHCRCLLYWGLRCCSTSRRVALQPYRLWFMAILGSSPTTTALLPARGTACSAVVVVATVHGVLSHQHYMYMADASVCRQHSAHSECCSSRLHSTFTLLLRWKLTCMRLSCF